MNYRLGEWVLYSEKNLLVNGEVEVKIEPKVIEVLLCLIHNYNTTVSKSYLLEQVWNDTIVTEHSLSKTISKLRKIFNTTNSNVIETISKKGYRLIIEPILIEDETVNSQIDSKRNFIDLKLPILLILSAIVVTFILFFSLSQNEIVNEDSPSFDILSLKNVTSETGLELTPDFSPDDTEIIYIKNTVGLNTELFIKNINYNKSRLLKTIEGRKTSPKFSPDGMNIAFYIRTDTTASIYTLSIENGKTQKLLELEGKGSNGLDWSPNGQSIVYSDFLKNSSVSSLHLLNIATRSTIQISFPNENTLGDETPSFSPDGSKIGFIRRKTHEIEDFGVIQLEENQRKVRNVKIEKSIHFHHTHGFSWNSEESIIYFSSAEGSQVLKMSNLNNETTTDIFNSSSSFAKYPIVANNGKSIAFSQWNSIQNIYKADLVNSKIENKQPIIESSREDSKPQFSPNGAKILFSSNRSGYYNLWISDANGGNPFQLTYLQQPHEFNGNWSPDGKSIVYAVNENDKTPVYLINSEGGLSRRIIDNGLNPIFSYDGSEIYYCDNDGVNTIKRFDIKKDSKIEFQHNSLFGYQFIQKAQDSYYVKENISGIWKNTLGQKEEKIIENYTDWGTSSWDVASDGIYYTSFGVGKVPSLFYYSFSTQTLVKSGDLSSEFVFLNGISVNDNKLLYTLLDDSKGDILILNLKKSIR